MTTRDHSSGRPRWIRFREKLSRCRQTLEQIQPGCTLPAQKETESSVQSILGHHTSVLGTLELDGKSAYKMETKGKSGRYTYDSANGRFTFTNGPLEGWPVVFEQGKNTFILRLAKSKDQSPNAKGPGLGEHSCTLK